MNQLKSNKDIEVGMASAILCALLWGVLPIYWDSLKPINPILIMFYRLVLVCVISFIADMFIYKWKGILEPLKKKGAIPAFTLAGIVISINWSLYIWLVTSGNVIQTSIGYYIEPLFVCIFGIVLFKEKMKKYILIAFILACIGVFVMLFSFGEIPALALALATSFAVYAALKKKLHAPAMLALFYETVFLVPFVLAIIIYMEVTGRGAFATAEPYKIGLLFLSGLFTATPLTLFGLAANRISLVALGITEYISPSMALILGIFLFKEPFDIFQFIGFAFIWIGLAIFTVGGIKSRNKVPTQQEEVESHAAD